MSPRERSSLLIAPATSSGVLFIGRAIHDGRVTSTAPVTPLLRRKSVPQRGAQQPVVTSRPHCGRKECNSGPLSGAVPADRLVNTPLGLTPALRAHHSAIFVRPVQANTGTRCPFLSAYDRKSKWS